MLKTDPDRAFLIDIQFFPPHSLNLAPIFETEKSATP